MSAPDWLRPMTLHDTAEGWRGELTAAEMDFCRAVAEQRQRYAEQRGRKSVYAPGGPQVLYNERGVRGEVFAGIVLGRPPRRLLWAEGEYTPGPDFTPNLEIKCVGRHHDALRLHERQAERYPAFTVFVRVVNIEQLCWLTGKVGYDELVTPQRLVETPHGPMFTIAASAMTPLAACWRAGVCSDARDTRP